MKVYRIEHPNGLGFYRGLTFEQKAEFSALFGYNPMHGQPHQSTPYEDPLYQVFGYKVQKFMDSRAGFGFSGKEQLLSWFTKEELMFIFSTLRCRLKLYETDEVVFLSSQVIFKHPKLITR